MTVVGILSLQGAFEKHRIAIEHLGVSVCYVRYPADLDGCDGLIIPGGESTTMSKLLDESGLRPAVLDFAKKKSVLGTCAGMILMATDAADKKVIPLGLINIKVSRNAYGRQIDSFTTSLELSMNGSSVTTRGVFIRAPRILSMGREVEVLARVKDEPVMVKQDRHMACTFHPELSSNNYVHQYFLDLIQKPVLA
jgi:5'-phosphate synthase pdxT subunit